jgi:hypothetical protein
MQLALASAARIYRARPGATFYGAPVGVLLLDDYRCPLIPGDTGNASTFPCPVRYAPVPGLTGGIILADRNGDYAQAAVEAAARLVEAGASAITGNCGFMIRYQEAVSTALPDVPVYLSSLLQLPLALAAAGPRGRVGLITADADALTHELIELAGGDPDRLTIVGLADKPAFRSSVLEESGTLDFDAIETELHEAASELIERDPAVGPIVLECAVLPPFAAVVQAATGRPVFDFVTLIELFHNASNRKPIAGHY